MSMLQEFKDFAVKGNVMDLAVGVIIGAAFGKIVDSVVNDLIMPIVGRATGGLDLELLHRPEGHPGRHTAHAGGGEEGGRAGVRLRQLHHHRHLLHHPRLDHLHHGEVDQPAEEGNAGGRAGGPRT